MPAVTLKYKKCLGCGSIGGQFNVRNKVTSKGVKYKYTFPNCVTCEREDARHAYHKRINNPKKRQQYRKRTAAYRERTKDHIKKRSKEYRKKNRARIIAWLRDYFARTRKVGTPKKRRNTHPWRFNKKPKVGINFKRPSN